MIVGCRGDVVMKPGAHHPDRSWMMNCLLPFLRCAHFARSPVQWMGPKRVVPPAFAIDDLRLPKFDAVLLSHNHYGEGAAGACCSCNGQGHVLRACRHPGACCRMRSLPSGNLHHLARGTGGTNTCMHMPAGNLLPACGRRRWCESKSMRGSLILPAPCRSPGQGQRAGAEQTVWRLAPVVRACCLAMAARTHLTAPHTTVLPICK